MAALLRRLGQPDRDSGWQQGQLLGVCPGEHTRVVRWDLLAVAFTDGPSTYGPRGKRHLFYWSFQKPASLGGDHRRLDLLSKVQLPDGISPRSTVNDLRATFGADHVRIVPGIEPQPANGRVTITGPAGALSKLYGLLSDAQPTGTSTWYSLEAGQICGE
jgi:hypothetical protein